MTYFIVFLKQVFVQFCVVVVVLMVEDAVIVTLAGQVQNAIFLILNSTYLSLLALFHVESTASVSMVAVSVTPIILEHLVKHVSLQIYYISCFFFFLK